MSRANDNNEVFLALLLPLQRSLEVYCRRILRKPSDVEDLLQSAVMEAFARFDRYAEGTNFRAWMFRFVTLEAFNRNRKREPASLSEFLDDLPIQPIEELPDDTLRTLIENSGPLMEQFEDHIVHALWQLTPSERAVLLLRSVGEFSYQEMHNILSIPLGSVMGYLSRARQKMRRLLLNCAAQPDPFSRHEEPQR